MHLLHVHRYGEALDAALLTRRPEVVASVLEELAMREGLGAALGALLTTCTSLFCCSSDM